jgi:anti-anti-sigma factor
MSIEFELRVVKTRGGTTITCSGELDIFGASKFRDAVELALRDEPAQLSIDGTGITLMTTAGIEAFVRTVKLCQSSGVRLDLEIGRHPRRILDLVGLWWLGVIDDGVEIETALQKAMARYAELGEDERGLPDEPGDVVAG